MSTQVAPQGLEKIEILAMSTPEDSGQKIIVMSAPDDDGQKIITMTSLDQEQKILITSIPEDEGQKILAMSLPEGTLKAPEIIAFSFNQGLFRGFNILNFKGIEETSLIKIFTKKVRERELSETETEEDNADEETEEATTLIDTEERTVEVSVMDMDETWWNDHLSGLNPETQLELASDIQWQMELLDKNETTIRVRDIPDEERTYPVSRGQAFVDRKTGAKMQLHFYRKNGIRVQRGTLRIEESDGSIREHEFKVPSEEELKKRIMKERGKGMVWIENNIIHIAGVTSVLGEIGTAIAVGTGVLKIGAIPLAIIISISGITGAAMVTRHSSISKIYTKKYKKHIERLSNDQETNTKKVSHKTFTTLEKIFTGLQLSEEDKRE